MSIGENIRALREKHDLTQAQLGEIAGVSDKAVSTWERGDALPRMGAIEKMANYFNISKAELIEDKPKKLFSLHHTATLPVLGRIPAGVPLDAIEDIQGYIDVPTAWVDDHGALIVIGDSMSPKYLDGDTVIFRIQPDCESGQDCVAYVNGYDATLKKVIKNGTSIVLQPINPEYAPIVGTEENPITILGVVVELRRKV